jgi:seryl-tRNA synthetase
VKFTVRLPKVIDAELATHVEDQGVYAAPSIRRVHVSDDRSEIEVECVEGSVEQELRPAVEAFVTDFVARFRRVAGKVHTKTTRRDPTPLAAGVFAELERRGWAMQLGAGQVGLAGPALAAARALDARWAALGREKFGAVEQVYPTLIPIDVLHRCEYFSSFPHLVSMVSHFIEDYETLKEVRAANAGAAAPVIPRRDAIAPPDACITPATCYHCYQSLEGRTIAAPGRAFTAVGRCARYESTNMTGLDRLWEFTMREIVFVGAEGWVAERRREAIAAVIEMLAEWDIECSIETANDPFFAPMYATKTFWQSQGDLKYEMRLTVAPHADGQPRTISAGSFNLHEGFFGTTFKIALDDGAPVFTGCTAFGVERWVLAFFTQHGLEPDRWPTSLRAEVFG